MLTGAFRNAAGALLLPVTPSGAGPVRAKQEKFTRSCTAAKWSVLRKPLGSTASTPTTRVQPWRVWARRHCWCCRAAAMAVVGFLVVEVEVAEVEQRFGSSDFAEVDQTGVVTGGADDRTRSKSGVVSRVVAERSEHWPGVRPDLSKRSGVGALRDSEMIMWRGSAWRSYCRWAWIRSRQRWR